MSRNISEGKWFEIGNHIEHKNLVSHGSICKKDGYQARVQKGSFNGPGLYFLLQYSQPCPRGCCYDDVNEVLTEERAKGELADYIEELTELKNV
jgi:hypothetical protein